MRFDGAGCGRSRLQSRGRVRRRGEGSEFVVISSDEKQWWRNEDAKEEEAHMRTALSQMANANRDAL